MDTSQIEKKIKENLTTFLVCVDDDSFRHRNHPQAKGNGGHYNLVVVSDDFSGMDLISRHRKIYDILQMKSGEGIHALSIRAHTVDEWKKKESA